MTVPICLHSLRGSCFLLSHDLMDFIAHLCGLSAFTFYSPDATRSPLATFLVALGFVAVLKCLTETT